MKHSKNYYASMGKKKQLSTEADTQSVTPGVSIYTYANGQIGWYVAAETEEEAIQSFIKIRNWVSGAETGRPQIAFTPRRKE